MLVGGDLGGPVIQDLALRHPDWVDRMVLFNSPLPYDKRAHGGHARRAPPVEAADYFVRQGTDADALAAELATPSSAGATSPPSTRRGSGPTPVPSHARAIGGARWSTSTPSRSPTPPSCGPSFGGYESVFDAAARASRRAWLATSAPAR